MVLISPGTNKICDTCLDAVAPKVLVQSKLSPKSTQLYLGASFHASVSFILTT